MSNSQDELLKTNLEKWYKKDNNKNLEYMLHIINGDSRISLRIVDWFVTNYAKEKSISYRILKNGEQNRFNVYMDYKLKLKAYSKRRFDPFCRWERTNIPYEDGTHIQTTIGQLNFFKWAIENDIIKYIEQNYSNIEQDMNERNSNSRKNKIINKETATRKKREELSTSASKSIKKELIPVTIKFN